MPTVSGAGCKLPVRPSAIGDTRSKELLEERTKVMSDLIAIAFACDLTRVFSMMYSGSHQRHPVLAGRRHRRAPQPLPRRARRSAAGARLHGVHDAVLRVVAGVAEGIPEAAGNILDNSVIYGSSDVSDGKAHSTTDYPLVVAGGGGGLLKHPGVHYRSTQREHQHGSAERAARGGPAAHPVRRGRGPGERELRGDREVAAPPRTTAAPQTCAGADRARRSRGARRRTAQFLRFSAKI